MVGNWLFESITEYQEHKSHLASTMRSKWMGLLDKIIKSILAKYQDSKDPF
ncbi:hypothetical protein FACS1894166_07890 [Bacilli bacterium]|nr:hypothetical protein FACS1894166_07890 [Bacilli bacterium]